MDRRERERGEGARDEDGAWRRSSSTSGSGPVTDRELGPRGASFTTDTIAQILPSLPSLPFLCLFSLSPPAGRCDNLIQPHMH